MPMLRDQVVQVCIVDDWKVGVGVESDETLLDWLLVAGSGSLGPGEQNPALAHHS